MKDLGVAQFSLKYIMDLILVNFDRATYGKLVYKFVTPSWHVFPSELRVPAFGSTVASSQDLEEGQIGVGVVSGQRATNQRFTAPATTLPGRS